MCWDRNGQFVGCPAPEFCHPPAKVQAIWEEELEAERVAELAEWELLPEPKPEFWAWQHAKEIAEMTEELREFERLEKELGA